MSFKSKIIAIAYVATLFFFYSDKAPAQVILSEHVEGQNTDVDPNSEEGSNVKNKQRKLNDSASGHTTLIQNFDGEETPTLQSKQKNGTYIYRTEPSPQKYSAGLLVGPYTLANLTTATQGLTYKNIYGNSNPFLVDFTFEYQYFKSAGKLGIKTGLGFFTAKGNGRFVTPPNNVSDAGFTLYAVPVSLAATYHLSFSERQIFVPYAEGGFDYFGLFESRDDKSGSDAFRYGGAPAAHWAAGLQIQLDFLDRQGLWDLDNEYGVNHVYLTAGARQFIGLSTTFDLTGLVYEGGFLIEF